MSTTFKNITGRCESETGWIGFKANYVPSEISLTRFAGGTNGAMVQVTISDENSHAYIQLTKAQVQELAIALTDAFDYDKYPSE